MFVLVFMKKVLLIFCFILGFADGYSQYIFKNEESAREKISLHQYTKIINVKDQALDIQQIISKFNSEGLNALQSSKDYLGYSNDNYWAKVDILNKTNSELDYILETGTPLTYLAELYIVDGNSNKTTKIVNGTSVKSSLRTFASREVLFSLEIKPNDNLHLYIHYNTSGNVMAVPMELYNYKGFYEKIAQQQFIDGVFYGFMILLSLFLFFLYLAIRKGSILVLAFFVFVNGFIHYVIDGYFFKFFSVQSTDNFNTNFIACIVLLGLLLGKYTELVLDLKKRNIKLFILFQIFYLFAISLIPLSYFISNNQALFLILTNISGVVLFLLILAGVYNVRLKYCETCFVFIFGILSFFSGFLIHSLLINGLLGESLIVDNSLKIGRLVVSVCFTIKEIVYVFKLRKIKNELMETALLKAEEMNDLKTYFLSNISHELRTPLNVILNLNKFIADKSSDVEILEKCDIIKNSSEGLVSSINDILDFYLIEKNEYVLKNEAFSLTETINLVNFQKETFAKQSHVTFKYEQSKGIPDRIMGDKSRVLQILKNVLHNAVKYTKSGGTVLFKVDGAAKENGKFGLVFTIIDSGIGIPKDKLESVFDSFFQLNISNTRKYGGLGLGLYIVKKLVDKHNGTIFIDSEPGNGTTVTINIDVDCVAEKAIEDIIIQPVDYDLGGKTILLVEDDKLNQMVIEMITKSWLNTTLVIANNGQEGLDAFKTNAIDIVLMDLQMPVMDGYEATIAIRNGEVGQEYKDIPIIAVSADVMASTKVRVKEIGINEYMSKPVKKENLYRAIKKLV